MLRTFLMPIFAALLIWGPFVWAGDEAVGEKYENRYAETIRSLSNELALTSNIVKIQLHSVRAIEGSNIGTFQVEVSSGKTFFINVVLDINRVPLTHPALAEALTRACQEGIQLRAILSQGQSPAQLLKFFSAEVGDKFDYLEKRQHALKDGTVVPGTYLKELIRNRLLFLHNKVQATQTAQQQVMRNFESRELVLVNFKLWGKELTETEIQKRTQELNQSFEILKDLEIDVGRELGKPGSTEKMEALGLLKVHYELLIVEMLEIQKVQEMETSKDSARLEKRLLEFHKLEVARVKSILNMVQDAYSKGARSPHFRDVVQRITLISKMNLQLRCLGIPISTSIRVLGHGVELATLEVELDLLQKETKLVQEAATRVLNRFSAVRDGLLVTNAHLIQERNALTLRYPVGSVELDMARTEIEAQIKEVRTQLKEVTEMSAKARALRGKSGR